MAHAVATIHVDGAECAVLVRDGLCKPLSYWGENRSVRELLADWDQTSQLLAQWAVDDAAFSQAMSLDDADICLPYRPSQVFCTGANYKKHVVGLIMGDPSMRTADQEGMTDEDRRAKVEAMMDARAKSLPFCFIKLPSCAVGARDNVVLPVNVEKPDWELELGVVIGRRTHRVTEDKAMEHVAGYAVVNDVTAREHIFRSDGSAIGADWLSGKCFPTFLPFGPMIVPRDQVADPYALTMTLSVNGKVYQDESTGDMMASIARQIAYLSDRVVLEPGDLICTGSPYGNGSAFGVFLKPGDVMEGTITGLGTQRNTCVAEGETDVSAS
jgi:2,4-didehydro-3-deoxy-L-rhamnonate hydrolase